MTSARWRELSATGTGSVEVPLPLLTLLDWDCLDLLLWPMPLLGWMVVIVGSRGPSGTALTAHTGKVMQGQLAVHLSGQRPA